MKGNITSIYLVFYALKIKYFLILAWSLQNNDNLSVIFLTIRALLSDIPFDVKEPLQEYFEKARKSYESVMKDKKNDFSESVIKIKII